MYENDEPDYEYYLERVKAAKHRYLVAALLPTDAVKVANYLRGLGYSVRCQKYNSVVTSVEVDTRISPQPNKATT